MWTSLSPLHSTRMPKKRHPGALSRLVRPFRDGEAQQIMTTNSVTCEDQGIDQALADFVRNPDTRLPEVIGQVLLAYPARTALAWRPLRGGQPSGDFKGITYSELDQRVRHVAAALFADAGIALRLGEPIGIMAFANVDFVTLNLALGLGGGVIAPLQTTASLAALNDLVRDLETSCLAGSLEHLASLVSLALAAPRTRTMIIFDHDGIDDDAASALTAAQAQMAEAGSQCRLIRFSQLIAMGTKLPSVGPEIPDGDDDDPLALIYYTSGSTGTPKGVMYSQRLVKVAYCNIRKNTPIVLHYQPLNHSFGMSYIATALVNGGTTYFTARSDLSTLLEDMRMVRPTAMAMVPRVTELLFHRYRNDYAALIASDEPAAFEKFRHEVIGGRLQDVVTGSAPTAPELRSFLERIAGTPPMDGYGATEVGGVTLNNRVLRPPVVEYRLIDVPELGYFTSDRPHPRGELIVKSMTMFKGYFGRPELTALAVDEEGFYHTGDIMAEIAPDQLVYLDRTNNVMKLSQGEFVPIAQLEALYGGADPAIRQIYLYGNSSRAFLLGVAVPNPEVIAPDTPDAEIAAGLLAVIARIAAANGRHAYEIPRDLIIEREPFSAENGLLAGIGKYLRPAFRERYEARLEALYESLAEDSERAISHLRAIGRTLPTIETVCRAADCVLTGTAAGVSSDGSFAASGGDSLSALSFALLLEEIYDVPVEVSAILHPSGTYGKLALEIDRQIQDKNSRATAISVHGGEGAVLRASDLALEKFLEPRCLEAAMRLSAPEDREPELVLLTGATGFLGRFICLEWLRRIERNGHGRLVCIARGNDDADAHNRLMAGFAGGDGALAEEAARLADGRLSVLAGDLAAPRLGLDAPSWERLEEEADLIVHPGALVNHKLPYRQLFAANVAGTAELIGLALTARMKRFVHVSTIATTSHGGRRASETDDIRRIIPLWTSSNAYADGYASSKWAAEILLAEAHEHYDLPVSVLRSGMILAPLTVRGQLNVPDMFTRLIFSLAVTGLAPGSFYDGDAARAHYEALPVDFLAQAIVAIGEAGRRGHHTYHALNPHDDGISLDSFVDWLIGSGLRIERITDFGDWHNRFATALRSLPEAQRQASVLPLIDAFAAPAPARPAFRNSAEKFRQAVRVARVGDCHDIPQIPPHLIARYVDDLRGLGLLPS